ncbi:MAG: glycosyltransferase family 2 protein [Ignavibacteria bacterium]
MALELSLKKKKLMLVLITVGFLFSILFLSWWFEAQRIQKPFYIVSFVVVIMYVIAQVYFLWYIYLNAEYPKKKKSNRIFKVDVFLPTYNEPLYLVEKALKAMVEMSYPHKTYLIDDGGKQEFKKLAGKYCAEYITRPEKKHYKAGNINNALKFSNGEIIAVFDVDHIPAQNYLDEVMGHFENPKIGVVQVALDHYNCNESFVANACYKLNDEFFAATMIGMSGCNSTVIFGSNSIFRRDALLSLGGYIPGLAEDLNTSIHLHAKGWESAYVAEILAKGLVPADLMAFFKQQLKWARGVFETLLRHFPLLFKHLNWKKRICYITRMTYYLAGPLILVHLIFTIMALFSRQINLHYAEYLLRAMPFVFMFFLIQVYAKYFYFIKEKKKGFNIEGLLLVLGTWPVYTLAFIAAILNIQIPFISTPKAPSKTGSMKIILPQIIIIAALLSGIIYTFINYIDYLSLITISFALIMILLHWGIFFATWESFKGTKSFHEPHSFEDFLVPKTLNLK